MFLSSILEYSIKINKIRIKKKTYQEDYDCNTFCGMLNGLAFLPLNRLQEGVDYLKLIIPHSAVELIQYVEETYVSRKICRINKQNTLSLTIRHFPKMFDNI